MKCHLTLLSAGSLSGLVANCRHHLLHVCALGHLDVFGDLDLTIYRHSGVFYKEILQRMVLVSRVGFGRAAKPRSRRDYP